MGWKKKPYDYRWDHNTIDHNRLAELCTVLYNAAWPNQNTDKRFGSVVHYSQTLLEGARIGSILLDLEYGHAFGVVESLHDYPEYDIMLEAMEEMYTVLDVGTLAQDHIKRKDIEDKWMIKKGFKNATRN